MGNARTIVGCRGVALLLAACGGEATPGSEGTRRVDQLSGEELRAFCWSVLEIRTDRANCVPSHAEFHKSCTRGPPVPCAVTVDEARKCFFDVASVSEQCALANETPGACWLCESSATLPASCDSLRYCNDSAEFPGNSVWTLPPFVVGTCTVGESRACATELGPGKLNCFEFETGNKFFGGCQP